jgi:enamine deaminase RidA (YjgF/YER057c/UK114 family)
MPWDKSTITSCGESRGYHPNVSGQVIYDETHKNVGRGDMEAQMCQAYTNIHKVFAQYGATMKILTDIPILVIQIEKLSDNKSVLGWKQMKTEKVILVQL